jgi:anaerobic magnesium-protoporphyrin IX monomethyl ester cyclase
VLDEFDKCSYVLRGEAEQSLVELVQRLQAGGDLESVKGLSYRRDGQSVHNPDSCDIRNLDSIPLPARELVSDAYRDGTYWRIGHKGVTDVIITSRGCPYRCNFCFKTSDKFRIRSPENILEELVYIRSQGTKNVHIMDDLFAFHKPRCLKILNMIKEQKLDMEFKVRARVDRIDEEMLVAMKEAGVTSVVYGVESGSQKVLDAMRKRSTVEMNYRAIAMTKKVGLQCYADLFLGFPGETPETIRETETLIMKAKPTAINMSVMFPLPDTPVYDQAREQGTLIGDWDVKGTRPWIKLPWTEDRATLWRIRNRLHRKFLLNPVVIFNALRFMVFRMTFRQLKTVIRYYYMVTFKFQR